MTGFLPVIGALGIAGVLVAAVAGCGNSHANGHTPGSKSPHASSSAADATVVTTFTPYTSTGTLTVPVATHVSGHCWTGSIVVSAPDAYRCLVGTQIADPCFAPRHGTAPGTVACVSAPWSSAQVVTLTQALPKIAPRGRSASPWAVLLANGARCVAATGTVQSVGNVSLNLLCPGGTGAGGLDTSRPKWRVKYGAATTGELTDVAVAAAWTA
jgi:hypothetical protein